MINASELRIGNYLERMDGSIFQVNCDDFSLIEKTPIKPYPIPLTEEWLLNFGFSKHTKRWSLSVGGELFDYHILDVQNEFPPLWHCKNEGYTISGQVRNTRQSHFVKYVHQLQNLYFALTGTELTLTQKSGT